MSAHRPEPLAIRASVSPEQLTLIKAHLQQLPDLREPIVNRVKTGLGTYEIDPRTVAEKMLGRLIGDMVR